MARVEDIDRPAKRLLNGLMADGQWHTTTELEEDEPRYDEAISSLALHVRIDNKRVCGMKSYRYVVKGETNGPSQCV